MRVGLIDVDSHNFPNLCLMKLSEYHTRRGDRVEWWDPAKQYDLVYKSRVFTDTYSKDTIQVNNADKVIQGGTGYGPGENLPHEIEHIRPDYFLYPRFLGTAYGFLSRGCPRNCGFCIVSGKEGRRSVRVADLSEFWNGEEEIKLMDPNLLAWLLPTSFLPSMRKTGSSPARWNGCGRKQISMTPLSMKKTAPISGLRRRNCKSGSVRFAVS